MQTSIEQYNLMKHLECNLVDECGVIAKIFAAGVEKDLERKVDSVVNYIEEEHLVLNDTAYGAVVLNVDWETAKAVGISEEWIDTTMEEVKSTKKVTTRLFFCRGEEEDAYVMWMTCTADDWSFGPDVDLSSEALKTILKSLIYHQYSVTDRYSNTLY